jgi:protein-S-isoprenylcysteine O-methyltransferase Ste14
MPLPITEILIFLLWAGFLAYWWITALLNRAPFKRVSSRLGVFAFMAVPIAILFAAAILLAPDLTTLRVLPDILPVAIAGLAVTAAGITFAVWARLHLGKNWSAQPAVREHHTLIRTGPYAIVRHPIYTGILTGILGTAIASGTAFAFITLGVVIIVLIVKLRIEEQFMIGEFGEEYERYRHEVKALVPWVV